MPVASDNFGDTSNQRFRIPRNDYPTEVDEVWMQESQGQAPGIHMRVSGKQGHDWLEPGPEIDAKISP